MSFHLPANERFRDLFERIRRGGISPEEGEAKALARGGSLNPLPDLDPTQEWHWKLITTIAWIAWRNPEHVRWLWGPFRQRAQYWSRRLESIQRANGCNIQFDGWVLKPVEPPEPSMRLLVVSAIGEDIGTQLPKADTDAAERQLSIALKAGQLPATGRDILTDQRRLIEPIEFIDLELADGRGAYEGEVLLQSFHNAEFYAYRDVVVNVEDVLRLWPSGNMPLPAVVEDIQNSQKFPLSEKANPARTGAHKTPSDRKIAAAIAAEEDAGGTIESLRPGERNKRLSDRMKLMRMKESEIPSERSFRRYFNNS